MSKRGKKRPGHYCWCCGRRRPNERFSRRGHQQHLCKDCKRLGKEEIAYRQHIKNISRLLTLDGIILKKRRADFERYLTHPDPRVRQYADKVVQKNEEWRALLEAQHREEELWEQRWETVEPDHPRDADDDSLVGWEDEDIPF